MIVRRLLQPIGTGPRRLLIQANRLKDQGRFAEAAELFERLGYSAQEKGLLRRAPYLLLQAAHCWLMAGRHERSRPPARLALSLFVAAQSWAALLNSAEPLIADMERLGYAQGAEEIRSMLAQILAEHPEASPSSRAEAQKRSPSLPPKCPFCGATMRSDQVIWIDETTAECAYCGSAVQGQL
jgi:hypothetical protein